jgi:hypothetical protein
MSGEWGKVNRKRGAALIATTILAATLAGTLAGLLDLGLGFQYATTTLFVVALTFLGLPWLFNLPPLWVAWRSRPGAKQ